MIQAAVLGYGNIGSGVVTTLLENREWIKKQAGDIIEPVCVLDLRDFPGDVMEKKVVRNITDITENPDIALVVETMGGEHPAYEFVDACLKAGKHVMTSNKALVAAFGPELLRTAREHHVNFFFEASVGGAIPIIRPLTACTTAEPLTSIDGILNGTTNYMLTAMKEENKSYDEALKTAQELGFAERNPAADVEGFDTCRKLAILTSLATGCWLDYKDIPTTGITKVTRDDIMAADALGYALRLLGSMKIVDGKVYARVAPTLIDASSPLMAATSVMNAVLVHGEMTGDLMFYGAGAGKLPTASAVVADMVEAVRYPGGEPTRFTYDEPLTLADEKDETSRFVVRLDHVPTGEDSMAYGFEAVVEIQEGFAGITKELSLTEMESLVKEHPVLSFYRISE